MAGEIQLNSVTLATESGGTISLNSDVDLATPTKTALNASGSAPIYACRAWVNFNGTGTVAIRASGNVSSITDDGTGNYTVNFTTAMPDANYCAAFGRDVTSTNNNACLGEDASSPVRSTTQLRILNRQGASGTADLEFLSVSIFR